MEKEKVLREYQTPVIETVLLFADVYTATLAPSPDAGAEYPDIWD